MVCVSITCFLFSGAAAKNQNVVGKYAVWVWPDNEEGEKWKVKSGKWKGKGTPNRKQDVIRNVIENELDTTNTYTHSLYLQSMDKLRCKYIG